MAEPVIRKIIHVDMDAFYASVEQRDDPDLRGKPVAVGYGAKRGVVAAASYEARDLRRALGNAVETAMRQCPDSMFVPPSFEVYRAVSRQIRDIFADYTSLIEPLSLDEAYLDVTENRRASHGVRYGGGDPCPHSSPRPASPRLPVFRYNKFLAKLASDMRKPNGQFVIPPQRGEEFIESLPVKKFHGVGPVTAEKLNALGILTGADLKAQPLAFLEQHFGKAFSCSLTRSKPRWHGQTNYRAD